MCDVIDGLKIIASVKQTTWPPGLLRKPNVKALPYLSLGGLEVWSEHRRTRGDKGRLDNQRP